MRIDQKLLLSLFPCVLEPWPFLEIATRVYALLPSGRPSPAAAAVVGGAAHGNRGGRGPIEQRKMAQ
jgi:hypothetical protein